MKHILITVIPALFLLGACQKNLQKNGDSEIGKLKAYGHEQGNGTDNVPFGFGAAWFLGESNDIRYCSEIATDFGSRKEKVNQELESAFSSWKQYIQDKRINEKLEQNQIDRFNQRYNYPSEIPPHVIENAKLFRLSTRTIFLSKCDGTEDIKFYFGAEDDLVTRLKKNYHNPTAFSFRREYNKYDGKSKGLIWLAKQGALGDNRGNYPDWSLPNRILGVLIHELGHVYGVGHIEGTIMREDMFGLLLRSEWTSEDQANIEYKMRHIDHENELFLPELEENSREYLGELTYKINFKEDEKRQDIEKNFEFLVGRKPLGKVVSKYSALKLIISDEQSETEFEIKADTVHASSTGKGIFKAERSWPDQEFLGSGAGSQLSQRSVTTVGQIENSSGIKVPILFHQNLGYSPMRITYIQDGQENALMVMDFL